MQKPPSVWDSALRAHFCYSSSYASLPEQQLLMSLPQTQKPCWTRTPPLPLPGRPAVSPLRAHPQGEGAQGSGGLGSPVHRRGVGRTGAAGPAHSPCRLGLVVPANSQPQPPRTGASCLPVRGPEDRIPAEGTQSRKGTVAAAGPGNGGERRAGLQDSRVSAPHRQVLRSLPQVSGDAREKRGASWNPGSPPGPADPRPLPSPPTQATGELGCRVWLP